MNATEVTELVAAAWAAIAQIVATVEGAKSGAVDPKAALDAITAMRSSLAENDAVANKALDDKFAPGGA